MVQFSVNNFGDLTANSANLSGIISASAGTIGGWSVGSSTLSLITISFDSSNNSIDITTTNVNIEISSTGSLPPGTNLVYLMKILIIQPILHQVLTLLHILEEQIHMLEI